MQDNIVCGCLQTKSLRIWSRHLLIFPAGSILFASLSSTSHKIHLHLLHHMSRLLSWHVSICKMDTLLQLQQNQTQVLIVTGRGGRRLLVHLVVIAVSCLYSYCLGAVKKRRFSCLLLPVWDNIIVRMSNGW